MRGAGRASRERDDIRRAEESVDVLRRQRAEIEGDFARETETVRERYDMAGLELGSIPIPPRKADITIHRVALAWLAGGGPA